MKELKGIAASLGFAIGPVFLYEREEIKIEECQDKDVSVEWQRFVDAQQTAKEQISDIYEHVKNESGEEQAEIFSAQLMILDDPDLMDQVKSVLESKRINIESALHEAIEGYANTLEMLEDEYLKARALDIRDVGNRVLRILLGIAESPTEYLKEASIILADDLTPSDTVLISKDLILGFCIAQGGATSHTAILARGLGLPAVVGAGEDVLKVKNGNKVILDGSDGLVFIDPSNDMVKTYTEKIKHFNQVMKESRVKAKEPAITLDGHQVEVVANIGNVESAKAAVEFGAEGVGLLRTEFLYLERSNLPTEEEQYQSYKAIVEPFGKNPVILRTLDIGGDKELSYLSLPKEANPFLGVRAIRLCFARPDLFKPQLRAALRAADGKDLKIMFPMVATVDEVRQARAILEECQQELKSERVAFARKVDIGIMIEIPAAAIMSDILAKEIDFFSIGTNDLSQYTMAADRTNANVANIASSFQPSVLRLVKMVIDAAHKEGKWVGMCGELAGEPVAIPILLGLGLDEFSMNPPAIPIAKQIIRSISKEQSKEIADLVLTLENSEQVQTYVRDLLPIVNL
ncbi:MAG: phosphoenolpyruvate--protein phosphotransferase [Anaerolineaceae bacterium]|nr:phosphoenolpyruvate--protein phosphotransferase [Anaerolineaceae bacterium]